MGSIYYIPPIGKRRDRLLWRNGKRKPPAVSRV